MLKLNDKWYNAIEKRHSVREYSDKTLESDVIRRLENIASELTSEADGVKIVFVNENSHGVFKGMVGSYGKINDTQAFAAFIGDTSDINVEEKIGYYGEAFILEATALGLGTCWVSGTVDRETVKNKITLSENEKIYAVTPVGYAKEKASLGSNLIRVVLKTSKRKSLDEICDKVIDNKVPEWTRTALEAARIAPSAVNWQPWRFKIGERSITVTAQNVSKKNYSGRLDCGIAMLHIELGANKCGVNGKWQYLKKPDVAVFTQTEENIVDNMQNSKA